MNIKRKTLLSAFILLAYVFTLFAPVGLIPEEITLKPALAAGGIDSIVSDDGTIAIKTDEGLKTGVKKTKYLINMFSVFAILIITGCLLFAWIRVASSQGRGENRAEALKGVGWVLVAAAGVGATALIIGVAYNTFNS